jgi:DNA-binding beta-propeller fold protein YncE
MVSTLAGNGTPGFADGAGTIAQFNYPYSVAIDASGNLFVADRDNLRIRKITSAGVVSTLAGNGTAGFKDGAASIAQFNYTYGVAVDASGNIYVGDADNHCIRKIQ